MMHYHAFFLVLLLFEKREVEKQKSKERRKHSTSFGVVPQAH